MFQHAILFGPQSKEKKARLITVSGYYVFKIGVHVTFAMSDQSRYSLEPEISEEEIMRMEEASPAVLPMPAMGQVVGYSFEPEFSEEKYR